MSSVPAVQSPNLATMARELRDATEILGHSPVPQKLIDRLEDGRVSWQDKSAARSAYAGVRRLSSGLSLLSGELGGDVREVEQARAFYEAVKAQAKGQGFFATMMESVRDCFA